MLDLDPDQTAVPCKDASTVVVAREAPSGIEVFCVERHRKSGFLGGAIVFPGGKVDEEDAAEVWAELTTPLASRARALGFDARSARAYAVAALRESLEEAALLPVVGDELGTAAVLALRAELLRHGEGRERAPTLARLLAERHLRLDAARLVGLGRWVTPTTEKRRYDTRFYLLAAPPDQDGAHDRHETTQSFWATPAEILQRWEQGEILLAPPTSRTLELFLPARTMDEAVTIAERQSLAPVCPCFTRDGDDLVLTLPGDPLHPEAGPPPADPAAPTRFVLIDGRFVSRRAQA